MKLIHSLGLDVHKSSASYHLLDRSGHRIARGKLKPERAEVQGLLHKISGDSTTVLVVAETTGMLHLGFCEAFQQAGCRVAAVNPLYGRKRCAKNAIRDNKTDRLDAESLAGLGQDEGEALLKRFGYGQPVERFGLQRLLSSREILRNSLTNMIKHTATTVDALFPELHALGLGIDQIRVRRLLRDHPSPTSIATLAVDELRTYVGGKADALKRAATDSFAIRAMGVVCEDGLLEILLDTLESLEKQIARIDCKIQDLLVPCAGSRTVRLANSLPGFGAKTTPAILAFITPRHLMGGSKRKIARRLQALFGADPRVKESGRWKGTARISKRGIRIARTALFQAAFCGMINDPQLRQYYLSLKARGKKHKPAIVDLMRKQLERLVAVLVDQQPFTPHLHQS